MARTRASSSHAKATPKLTQHSTIIKEKHPLFYLEDNVAPDTAWDFSQEVQKSLEEV
ncbi:MAG: hypothetical protein FRX48_07147 [Lasallia pustulata]|uniref:Uncharacterized protein n=1 Tax=Lasallia pustulata TaxID=136370 RepID=A0A5M8PIC9_9LECA|nr:MAG: hypothetical protein FRX48_07147 [Lasallia pustulata]